MDGLSEKAKILGPGLLFAVMTAMAAQFLSDHYGAPVMLMAILLGIPFHFLSEEPRTAPGIAFASRDVLRIGVALLGLRISVDMLQIVGWPFLVLVVAATIATILLSILFAGLFGREKTFGFLTGGAVAICGASAAMAINSILPKRDSQESDLIFTVIVVTVLSTLSMIAYPLIAEALGFSIADTGLFLGATIHDVAQVVGAGYSVSDEAGDIATLVKLFRVTMLAPIVFVGALLLRRSVSDPQEKPPLVPVFVIVFLILAVLNSLHLVPVMVKEGADSISRAALVTAVAAVGMKTSIAKLREVGAKSLTMLAGQTVFLALVIAVGLMML